MPSTLHEGHYRVICRERTALAAKAMGRGEVFPQAEMLGPVHILTSGPKAQASTAKAR